MIVVVADKDTVEIIDTGEGKATSLEITWPRAEELQSALSAVLAKRQKREAQLAAT